MMRVLSICLLLLLGSVETLEASERTSLSQSVNQAKTQGKVLSAKTRNGEHVIKVLTSDGRIKTIKKPAIKSNAQAQSSRSNQVKDKQRSKKKVSSYRKNRNWGDKSKANTTSKNRSAGSNRRQINNNRVNSNRINNIRSVPRTKGGKKEK